MDNNLRNAIGLKHWKSASSTVPGMLASVLSRFLYSADEVKPEDKYQSKKISGQAIIDIGFKEPLGNAKTWVEKNGKIETLKMLRECRDLLEVIALREVID